MTLLAAAAAQQGATTTTTTSPITFPLPLSATEAPWNSSTTPCVIPTYDGSGATIHPSVVDMGAVWNGYRWWMANTPYANMNDDLENPCIWGSNDRRTWHVPSGLVNPIDPQPEHPWFHSDTELTYDPDTGRLIVFYRLAIQSPVTIYLRAQSSPDGVTWTDHGTIANGTLSPAVWRAGAGDWRLWTFSTSGSAAMWTATNPLGPWTSTGTIGFNGWHGDVIWYEDRWLCLYTTTGTSGLVYARSSFDGLAWSPGTLVMTGGAGGGWDDTPYRPTIIPSTEEGFIDCWYSAYGDAPGTCATDYVRLPDTLWPDPPA